MTPEESKILKEAGKNHYLATKEADVWLTKIIALSQQKGTRLNLVKYAYAHIKLISAVQKMVDNTKPLFEEDKETDDDEEQTGM